MLFLYNGNPTEGLQDGTVVSTGADFSNAISMKLNSTNGEERVEKLAIRCQSGFKVEGTARLSFAVNDTLEQLEPTEEEALMNKWAFSTDNSIWGSYGEAITVSNVEDNNVIVYVKCKAEQGELPSTENRVQIVLEGTVMQKEEE